MEYHGQFRNIAIAYQLILGGKVGIQFIKWKRL